MKTVLCFSGFFFLFLFNTSPQNLASVDTNKYRINLPDFWKPGNKIWEILTDKLPIVCEEIRDKDLCGDDCNPRYTIEFEMSMPVVIDYQANHVLSSYANNQISRPTETWDIQTIYAFESSLYLTNEKGDYIKRFIIVDMNERWKTSSRVTMNSYAPPPPLVLYNRRPVPSRFGIVDPLSNFSNQQIIPVTGQEGETPFAYIAKNKEKLAPAFRDMFTVIDQKISSW